MNRRCLVQGLVSAIAIVTLAGMPAGAQGVLPEETVITGPQYANQIFYSLAGGTVRTSPLVSWDVAFELTGFTSAVLANGGAGVELFAVPGKSAADWASPVDTAGIAGWPKFYNSTATWSSGAFNMGRDPNSGDFGWGEYNVSTHVVSGTALYVIRLADKSYRKIVIESLASRRYTFRVANLDGSNERTATIAKDDYPGRHFAYYSIMNAATADVEPDVESWDLLFGKYIAMVGQDGTTPYGVSGILTNEGVEIAELTSNDPANEPMPAVGMFHDSIGAIGYDWKTFTGTTWTLDTSRVYFVRTRAGAIHRLRFTGFSGSGSGTYTFENTRLAASAVEEHGTVVGSFALYPNVVRAGDAVTVVYGSNATAGNVRLELHNMRGVRVAHMALAAGQGMHQQRMMLDLPAGVYLATIAIDGRVATGRLIIQ